MLEELRNRCVPFSLSFVAIDAYLSHNAVALIEMAQYECGELPIKER